MQVLSLQGDHYQMGRQHGQQVLGLRPLIAAAIDARLEGLAQHGRLNVRLLSELEPAWTRNAHSTMEMLRGMAETLELPFSQLFHYAAASYLDDVALSRSGAEACTVWAASGPATHQGAPILTKNRDYSLKHLPLQALAYAAPREGYRYLYVTSAGSPAVFSSGMNERGLAVADTHVPSKDIGPGLARYVLMMNLLEKHATVTSALSYLEKAEQMGAGNLILADAQGDVVVVESGYKQFGLVSPVENIVAATNHFVSSELCGQYLEDYARASGSESRARLQVVQTILKEHWGTLDVETTRQLMAQHKNGSVAICRHDTSDDTSTISNAIFLPAERKLLFCNSRPCGGSYVTYTL